MCRRFGVVASECLSGIEHRYREVKALTITSLNVSWLQSIAAKSVLQVNLDYRLVDCIYMSQKVNFSTKASKA